MTSPGETTSLIALLRGGRRSWAQYASDVAEAGSAASVLASEHGLLGAELAHRAEAELAAWEQRGIRVLTLLDPRYPPRLRAVRNPPPVLFVTGRLTPADRHAVAVIGSRHPSDSGRRAARRIAGRLVADGYTVISGLAAGIDTEAHDAALQAGGRTLAVLGNGLDHVYPAQNAALQRRLATQCAVISHFWPEAPPSRRSFPLRNGVMAGLSVATVIVEATHTSGTRIQARLALEQSRLVILLASLLEQPWAAELATRSGVEVVRSPEDVVTAVQDRLGADAAIREPQPIASGPGRAAMLSTASERSVGRLTRAAEGCLLGPRQGCCVCRRCFNFTGGYELCYACAAGEQHADVVVPISYSVAHEELHRLLASYKRTTGFVADRATLIITALLWRFLSEHEGCVAGAVRARSFDVVTTVPSSDSARDHHHPLRRIVGELAAPTRERHAQLLRRTSVDVMPRRFHPHRFEALRRLDGASVLLIDDTWTSGASAQSAAAALKAAGAKAVAAVVVGRHVNREWHENDRRLRGLGSAFEWSRCAVCGEHGRLGLAAA